MESANSAIASNSNRHHGEHIILRLTYISCYNNHNDNGEVNRILAQARENNERNGITGALVFNHNYFLQSIEGARPVINDLMRKLIKDNRHFSLQIIECSEIDERRWDAWSMKYLTPTDQNRQHSLKYSTGVDFNPYLMSTTQIMKLIDTLSKAQSKEQKAVESTQHAQSQPPAKKSWFSFS